MPERADGSATKPGLDPAEEDRLVERAQGGDVRAFDALLSSQETRVLRVLRLLGVPGPDREDVAQEIFVRVFRFLDRFRRGRPFGAWVYGITVNAAHDYRVGAQRRRHELLGGHDGAREPADPGPGPGAAVERRDERRALERALAVLSERERAVFVLCEMEGLTSREVGRSLGISSITVRRHLGRARTHLQQTLAEHEPGGKSTSD